MTFLLIKRKVNLARDAAVNKVETSGSSTAYAVRRVSSFRWSLHQCIIISLEHLEIVLIYSSTVEVFAHVDSVMMQG
jgi:hypothetical protein